MSGPIGETTDFNWCPKRGCELHWRAASDYFRFFQEKPYRTIPQLQGEILCVCEAAHMLVIWATQVLESLAKNGIPPRSEITEAAIVERAECVMLNKGPYSVTAVRVLGDILRRMQSH